jgi:OOP family OmpA-OmpF porin
MEPIRALGLALVLGCAAGVSLATAQSGQSVADDVIYDMSVPWPFRHVDKDDADGDGVFDARDACPGTPRGAVVDINGCPLDADGDGVPDGIDRCPATPRGATVHRYGCPIDSDGDGVPDGIDQCERTPKGATVNARGCPSDTDQDGVMDGIDQCPGTDIKLAVNKKGCPILVSEVGQEFLDGEAVAFNIEFPSGKADISPASYVYLDSVGVVLNDWPEAKVEIGGYTDSQGAAQFNERLSEQRAQAVKAYLTSKYKKIRPGNLTPKGYGESDPVASNDTAEGRAMNRRVEFKLLNGSELGQEVKTKRYKQRNE